MATNLLLQSGHIQSRLLTVTRRLLHLRVVCLALLALCFLQLRHLLRQLVAFLLQRRPSRLQLPAVPMDRLHRRRRLLRLPHTLLQLRHALRRARRALLRCRRSVFGLLVRPLRRLELVVEGPGPLLRSLRWERNVSKNDTRTHTHTHTHTSHTHTP